MGATPYHISNMRAVPTVGKVKEKNPDRLLTVYGEFRHDKDGKPTGDPLTITQKVIDRETALDPVFRIDVENGILVLPSGERGRKAVAGESQENIDAMLAALRENGDENDDKEAAS